MSSHAPSEGTFFVEQQAAPPAPAPTTPPVAPPAPPAPEVPTAPLQAAPPPTDGAMRDVPLGTLIFRAGLLAEEQLEEALQEGMRTGKRLGEVLSQRGLILDADLGRLLAGQQGLPYVDIATVPVDPVARQLLPDGVAKMQNALAFAFEDSVPVVAVADPTNELVIENVRRALGSEPRLVVAAHGELARKIDEVYSAVAPAVLESAASVAVPEPEAAVVEQPMQVEQPAPVAAAPAPMPTVVPPAEERAPEGAQAPLVVAPPTAPAEVPPLHAPAAAEAPLAPEPTMPQPAAPAPEPAPEVPASVEPAPAAPAAPEPADPGLFVQAAEQALAPPAEEAPVAVTPEPAPVEPAAPAPEPAVAPTVDDAADVTPTHFVVLRLTGEDHVEIGGFASQEEAQSFARTVVGRISRAEEQTDWPFFADRFLRPQTIVSVDVVEHQAANWMGSQLRSQWANTSGG